MMTYGRPAVLWQLNLGSKQIDGWWLAPCFLPQTQMSKRRGVLMMTFSHTMTPEILNRWGLLGFHDSCPQAVQLSMLRSESAEQPQHLIQVVTDSRPAIQGYKVLVFRSKPPQTSKHRNSIAQQ